MGALESVTTSGVQGLRFTANCKKVGTALSPYPERCGGGGNLCPNKGNLGSNHPETMFQLSGVYCRVSEAAPRMNASKRPRAPSGCRLPKQHGARQPAKRLGPPYHEGAFLKTGVHVEGTSSNLFENQCPCRLTETNPTRKTRALRKGGVTPQNPKAP